MKKYIQKKYIFKTRYEYMEVQLNKNGGIELAEKLEKEGWKLVNAHFYLMTFEREIDEGKIRKKMPFKNRFIPHEIVETIKTKYHEQ